MYWTCLKFCVKTTFLFHCTPSYPTYVFSLISFIVNNYEHFQTNSAIYDVNTRNKNQLHRPIANILCLQKKAYYAGIKVFRNLPSSLTSLIKKEQFKVKLTRYLITHSSYSVDGLGLTSYPVYIWLTYRLEAQNLLGCTVVFLIEGRPTFQRSVLPPSSGRCWRQPAPLKRRSTSN
jgi:hypothetical protein